MVRRRAASCLQKARAQCSRLQREASAAEDPSVPLEHLRTAVYHLAAVERWLGSGGLDAPDDTPWRRVKEEAVLTREVSQGSDSGAALFDLKKGEVFLKAIPCLLTSTDFRHPGKLFVSTGRFFFHSCVMGIEVKVGAAWIDVAQVRLLATSYTTTYSVRVSLKQPVDLDGSGVDLIDVELFDLIAVGDLHRFSTYFTGAGLFSMWPERGEGSPADSFLGDRLDGAFHVQEMVKDLEQQPELWELERRTSIFQEDWRAPFLPHDGEKQWKWTKLGAKYSAHALPANVSKDEARASSRPPIPEVNMFGMSRPCEWHVVVDEFGDREGWQYAVDFYLDPDYWQPTLGFFSHARRRKWRPTFVTDSVTDLVKGVEGSFTELIEPGSPISRRGTAASVGSASPVAGGSPLSRRPLVSQSDMNNIGMILDQDVGFIPLKIIATELDAADWQAGEGLMPLYFRDLRAFDTQISAWARGGAAARVRGKVRSIQMRVPVPKIAMCPEHTRVTCTYHVVCTDTEVVLECTTMSLDVPYGKCFNVITCDTFFVDQDSGHTRMVRTLGIEWIENVWMKSIVEANVRAEVEKQGNRWVEVIAAWGAALAVESYADVFL